MAFPRRDAAVGVEGAGETCHRHGRVIATTHAFFARGDQLDRHTGDRFGNLHGLIDVVVRQSPAESAPGQSQVQLHILQRHLCRIRGDAQRFVGVLRWCPRFNPGGRHHRGAVHRFERRMFEIGGVIFGLDHFRRQCNCRRDIAFLAHHVPGRV